MSDFRPHAVERAFEIAREGRLRNASDIAAKLADEGYANPARQLTGRVIRRQLHQLIAAAREAAESAP
jgi:hypothetical protein